MRKYMLDTAFYPDSVYYFDSLEEAKEKLKTLHSGYCLYKKNLQTHVYELIMKASEV
jgi:hypothetical protein